jgi:hypothetical protein
MKMTIRAGLLTLLLTLALAPVALAQDSSSETGYGGDGGDVLSTTDQSTSSSSSGELPFTGLDLAFVGIAGISLVGLGFGLRHVARQSDGRS